MRKFADHKVKVNTSAIGSGFHSHTMEVRTETIITDLPEHHIVNENGAPINHRTFLAMPDENDYRDALNMRRGLKLQKGGSRLPKPVRINLIDTPGLNATDGGDEKHVQEIFAGLIKTKTIHLALITISPGPFTQGLKDAIKCYVDMFLSFSGIIAFVHTHFDYDNFHPACVQESRATDLKLEGLHKIMGRTTFLHFKIDCNISNKRPIRECITQNTIQKILELATFNRPVDMLHTVVNKTRKMRDIDKKMERISKKCRAAGELLRWESLIHDINARIQAHNEFFVRYNVAQPEVLYEERRDMEYEVIGQSQAINVRYQEKGVPGIPIIGRDLLCHEIQVVEEIGCGHDGGPWRSWWADFRPMSSLRQYFIHVKIYTTRREKYREMIEEKQKEYRKLLCKRNRAARDRDRIAQHRERWPQQIRNNIDDHVENIRALGFLANEVLMPEVFNALVDAEVYIGDTAQCLKKARKVYKELAKQGQI